MTDWERVEKLRAKGLDWQSIADDEKVGFRAEVTAGTSGRALKALYLERRSRRNRGGRESADEKSGGDSETKRLTRTSNRFIGVGIAVALLAAVWFGVTYAYPNAGFLTPFPDLLYLLVAGLVLIAIAYVLGGSIRDFTAWRKVIVIGVALGLVSAGGVALYALSIGLPNLTPISEQQVGGNWSKAGGNQLWSEGGHPVLFFMGSIACPYCSASSWAIYGALAQFGTWSGTVYGSSNPSDVYPCTPEIEFPGATFSSNLITADIQEGNDNTQLTHPPLNNVENDYVTTYDSPSQSIPFLVAGGIYLHGGSNAQGMASLVNPAILSSSGGNSCTTADTPQQVGQAITSQQGPIYSAVMAAQLYFEAILAKICQKAGETPPASVTGNPQVAQYMLSM
jgi:hypothetical protein